MASRKRISTQARGTPRDIEKSSEMTQRTKSRTRIKDDWQPSAADIKYAQEHGVDHTRQVERVRDYHLMHGSLMADWPAAWRTWIRNKVKWAKKNAETKKSATAPADDPWGITAWAQNLPDVEIGTVLGEPMLILAGYGIEAVALDICAAAGIPKDV